MKAKSNHSYSVAEAADQLGIHRQTLGKRLKSSGIKPDGSGRYSLKQLVEVHAGDFHQLRNRKLTAEAQLAELDLGVKAGKLWPEETFQLFAASYWSVFKAYLFRLPDEVAGRISANLTPGEISKLVYTIMGELLAELRLNGAYKMVATPDGKEAVAFQKAFEKQFGQHKTHNEESTTQT